MRRSPRHCIAALVLIAAVLAGAAGCGREQQPDLVNGKEKFVEKCGRCHVLGRANASGVTGPNLDVAFSPARQDGLGEQTVAGVVKRQILHPRRGSAMPAGLLGGQDAADVAAYVGEVAGQGGEDEGALAAAGAPKVSNKPAVAKGGKLSIPADPSGGLAFQFKKAQSMPGSVEIDMTNPSSVQHDIALKDSSGNEVGKGDQVGKGGTSKFTAKLKAGDYEFLCTVPGHEQGGMKGTLTVK